MINNVYYYARLFLDENRLRKILKNIVVKEKP